MTTTTRGKKPFDRGSITDALIGQNVVRLRGEMSQTQLAGAMNARGWSWTQSTVSQVESGTRTLKAAEALDLTGILDVPVFDLMSENLDRVRRLRRELDRAHQAIGSLGESIREFEDARLQAVGCAEEMRDGEFTKLDRIRLEWITTQTIPDLFEEIRTRNGQGSGAARQAALNEGDRLEEPAAVNASWWMQNFLRTLRMEDEWADAPIAEPASRMNAATEASTPSDASENDPA